MTPYRQHLQSKASRALIYSAVSNNVAALVAIRELKQAVSYLAPDLVVKTTRQRRADKRDRNETFLVTIGAPAYRQGQFVKACVKAQEPFPIKKVQLKYWPVKRA